MPDDKPRAPQYLIEELPPDPSVLDMTILYKGGGVSKCTFRSYPDGGGRFKGPANLPGFPVIDDEDSS